MAVYRMMDTHQYLRILMQRYTVDHLVTVSPDEFEQYIKSLPGTIDETVTEPEYQRDASVKFAWGHNHDFGSFQMQGKMGNRHFDILTKCIDEFGLPKDLSDKTILDVGCWTGGTSLLLAAMDGIVDAIDEVRMYMDALGYLRTAFDIPVANLAVARRSLYQMPVKNCYDYVFMLGVLYHVTDPVLALRIAFNCLRDGGVLFLETTTVYSNDCICEYQGPNASPRTWNWFVPSVKAVLKMCDDVGFDILRIRQNKQRALISCARTEYRGMLRAGLSRGNV